MSLSVNTACKLSIYTLFSFSKWLFDVLMLVTIKCKHKPQNCCTTCKLSCSMMIPLCQFIDSSLVDKKEPNSM